MKRYTASLIQNTTITVSLADDQDIELLLTQAGSGSYEVTWVNVDKWLTPTGDPPTLRTTVGESDMIELTRADGVVYGRHTAETGPAGEDGATGPVGLNWRGAYSSGDVYATNDAVYYEGSSYIALKPSDSTNAQQPDLAPTYWSPIAAAAAGGGGGGGGELSDNFTRADNSDISAGAPNGISYTKVAGTATEIKDNMLHTSNYAGAEQHVRCETVMSSTDHHAQVTIGLFDTYLGNALLAGAACRYDAAADTAYLAYTEIVGGTTWHIRLDKLVNGSRTNLGTVALAGPVIVGDRIKLAVQGTTLTAYLNDVQQVQVTDSSITTGVRAGVALRRNAASVNVSISEFRFGT